MRSVATHTGPETSPNACQPSAVRISPWTMTGPTPSRADSRSADAAASTQPTPPNMYVSPMAPGDRPRSRVANRISTAICMWWRICHSPASHASACSVRLCRTSFRPSRISAPTVAFGTGIHDVVRRAHPPQHQRGSEERERVEQDRERRGQELDQSAREPRTDQRRRRLAEDDLRVRLDQPRTAGELREQHLIGRAADDVLHAAEKAHGEQDVHRQDVEVRGDGNRQQRGAAPDIRGDHDRQLAHAIDQHAGMQTHERERQRLQRDQHAHLPRRRVQQHRGRQRQREVRDLRAERRDRQRAPELQEVRVPPETVEDAAESVSEIGNHADACFSSVVTGKAGTCRTVRQERKNRRVLRGDRFSRLLPGGISGQAVTARRRSR